MTDPLHDYRPALVNGHATEVAPAFDPDAVIATIERPSRPTGTEHFEDDFREPPSPAFHPPAGVAIPDDLAAAYALHNERHAAWLDATEAVIDYRDDARQSRARRAAAIKAAGQAVAAGKKRPPIPSEISEGEERTEVQVLSTVVETRYREAESAARAADKLVGKYAAEWSAHVIGSFGPALDKANDAVQAALLAVGHAEGIRHVAARWRAVALGYTAEQAGARVTTRDREAWAGDLLDAGTTDIYARRVAQHSGALSLLGRVNDALGELRQCDPAALPHPDTIRPGLAGYGNPGRVYQLLLEAAGPEHQAAARRGHWGAGALDRVNRPY